MPICSVQSSGGCDIWQHVSERLNHQRFDCLLLHHRHHNHHSLGRVSDTYIPLLGDSQFKRLLLVLIRVFQFTHSCLLCGLHKRAQDFQWISESERNPLQGVHCEKPRVCSDCARLCVPILQHKHSHNRYRHVQFFCFLLAV